MQNNFLTIKNYEFEHIFTFLDVTVLPIMRFRGYELIQILNYYYYYYYYSPGAERPKQNSTLTKGKPGVVQVRNAALHHGQYRRLFLNNFPSYYLLTSGKAHWHTEPPAGQLGLTMKRNALHPVGVLPQLSPPPFPPPPHYYRWAPIHVSVSFLKICI